MRLLIVFEIMIILAIVMLTQVWIISVQQHLISAATVVFGVVVYQAIKRLHLKNQSISALDIGLDMCITAIFCIVLAVVFSQIVFVPMYAMENIIAITMGVMFYTLSLEAVFILPSAILYRIRLRSVSVLHKSK